MEVPGLSKCHLVSGTTRFVSLQTVRHDDLRGIDATQAHGDVGAQSSPRAAPLRKQDFSIPSMYGSPVATMDAPHIAARAGVALGPTRERR
jgi:hypothetical protein